MHTWDIIIRHNLGSLVLLLMGERRRRRRRGRRRRRIIFVMMNLKSLGKSNNNTCTNL
jgi:hypothetical protein